MIFLVWAPQAERVELVAGDRRVALAPIAGGYWQTDAAIDQGRGYKYSIDGAAPIPDPRSRWQPEGVHGDSYLLPKTTAEAQRREFRPAPLKGAVIYELHLGTFTPEGTYDAAERKLDHLSELGITHVELMPLASFPGQRGWGYDGVHLFAPFPAYGTPAQLSAFVEACHVRGLAVILDVVYNHLGPVGNYLGQYV